MALSFYDIMNGFVKRCTAVERLVLSELRNLVKSLYSYLKVAVLRRSLRGTRVEIGSISPREGFYTLDISRKADFPFDLRIGMPFPSGFLSFVYAEHVLEHFSYDECMRILREVHRVLADGGKFSIVVPDVRPILRAYDVSDDEFDRAITFEYPEGLRSRLDIVNFLMYMEGAHKYAFDTDNMREALQKCGFSEIRVREFDPALDRVERRQNSLYMECIKR